MRWPGSKAKMLDIILPLLPEDRTYIEPFGGSGAVLLSKPQSPEEIYSDVNPELVHFFRMLRQFGDELCDWVLNCDLPWFECRNGFVEHRGIERAGRWFMGIQRSWNALGNSEDATVDVDVSWFEAASQRLRSVNILHEDGLAIINGENAYSTVAYCDPPYLGARGIYGARVSHVMLLNLVREFKGHIVVSGYHNKLYDSFPWDEVIEVGHQVNITQQKRRFFECLFIKHARSRGFF